MRKERQSESDVEITGEDQRLGVRPRQNGLDAKHAFPENDRLLMDVTGRRCVPIFHARDVPRDHSVAGCELENTEHALATVGVKSPDQFIQSRR